MPRSHEHYLKDILQAIERIQKYIAGIELEQFKSDEMRIDSVLHNLMIIGEAVKNIPDVMREQAPNIRWRDIGRFRDRVVHHYFSLEIGIVWEIITVHLPPLKIHVEKLLEDQAEDDEHGE